MRYRNKTVYLLGAGFSAAMGAPILSRFIPQALGMLQEEVEQAQLKKSHVKRLNKLLGDLDRALTDYMPAAVNVSGALNNLEDLFCLVDLRASSSLFGRFLAQTIERRKNAEQHRWLLRRLILYTMEAAYQKHLRAMVTGDATLAPTVERRYLYSTPEAEFKAEVTPQSFNVCAYHAFLSRILSSQQSRDSLAEMDVIVTLNYDLLVEAKLKAFRKARIHYGIGNLGQGSHFGSQNAVREYFVPLPFNPRYVGRIERLRGQKRPSNSVPPQMVVPLVKLHGSLNWIMDDGIKPTRLHAIADPYNIEDDGNPTKRGMCEALIKKIPLIPPTWRKSPVDETGYGELMGQALDHFRLAGKIVIIGYSMPRTDGYFRYLLTEALCTPDLPDISVWDVRPKKEMGESIAAMFGTVVAQKVQYNEEGFLGFVRSRPVAEAFSTLGI